MKRVSLRWRRDNLIDRRFWDPVGFSPVITDISSAIEFSSEGGKESVAGAVSTVISSGCIVLAYCQLNIKKG